MIRVHQGEIEKRFFIGLFQCLDGQMEIAYGDRVWLSV